MVKFIVVIHPLTGSISSKYETTKCIFEGCRLFWKRDLDQTPSALLLETFFLYLLPVLVDLHHLSGSILHLL